jgi:hypothetical protein
MSDKDELVFGFLHKFKIYGFPPKFVDNADSQYLFTMELPICIFYSHYLFHVSSFVDLTLVIEGPRAR